MFNAGKKKTATFAFDDAEKTTPPPPTAACYSILSPYLNLLLSLQQTKTKTTGLLLRPADAPRPPRRGRREAPRLDDAPGREVHEGKYSFFSSFFISS